MINYRVAWSLLSFWHCSCWAIIWSGCPSCSDTHFAWRLKKNSSMFSVSRSTCMHESHPPFSESHSSLPCKAHACFLEFINETCNDNQILTKIFSSGPLCNFHPKIRLAWICPCEETHTRLLPNPAGKQHIWHSTSQEHPHMPTRWNVLGKH